MTVRKIVRRDTHRQQKSTQTTKFVPPKLPERPKVTDGPKSYGRTRWGRYIVVRFYVFKPYRKARWIVIDNEERKGRWTNFVARGTNERGYDTRNEAVAIARKYRDKYGSWSRLPF